MKPGVVSITQRDGTILAVRAFGDADLSYYVASDGTLLYLDGTDYYIAEVTADGTLAPTALLAHEPGLRSAREQ